MRTKREREEARRRLRDPQRLKYNYRPQFAVMVVCHDEHDQESVFDRLRPMGKPLRVVSV